MKTVEVHNQAELDAALAAGDYPYLVGDSEFDVVGSAQVRAYGSAQVNLSGYTIATCQPNFKGKLDTAPNFKGAIVRVPEIHTPEEWCEFYGAEIKDGLAILHKAVRKDFRSSHDFLYEPGTTPAAPDWDGGQAECGGGLHFCATPHHGLHFDPQATRFMACPVRLDEIVIHPSAQYPNKIKAPRVSGPIYEVDIDGKPL